MPIELSSLEEAEKLLSGSTSLLIIPHANVDPDGLSAALSCYLLFSAIGKKCTVLCPDTLPESLKFLPGYEKLENSLSVQRDFIITLDCSHGIEVEKLSYAVEENKVNIIVTTKKGSFAGKDVALRDGPLPYDLVVIVDTAELSLLGSVYENHKDLF